MTAPGADEPQRDEVKRQRVWPNVIQSRAEATRRDAHFARPRPRGGGGVRSVRVIQVRGPRGEARIGARRATKRLDL